MLLRFDFSMVKNAAVLAKSTIEGRNGMISAVAALITLKESMPKAGGGSMIITS